MNYGQSAAVADSRAKLLASIRRGLGVSGDESSRRQAVDERLQRHARNLIPVRGEGDERYRVTLFMKMLLSVSGTCEEVDNLADVPGEVARYLREHNLPARLRHGEDRVLSELPWHRAPNLTVEQGRAQAQDEVSLSHAFAGVAETGTLIMTSGADNPTTLNLLPENHLVVLEARNIAANYEDVWDRLRATYGEGRMPRTVNMITGPSRTADIEQQIQLGAHGPRRLHVIVVNGGAKRAE